MRQVLRPRSRLEPDPVNLSSEANKRSNDRLHLGGGLRLETKRARLVDHANRHGTQRYINAGKLVHVALK